MWLFVFVAHGGKSSIKMLSQPVLSLKDNRMLVVNAYYNGHTWELSGCPKVLALLENKEKWMKPTDSSEFNQLITTLKNKYRIKRQNIYSYMEANVTVPMAEHITAPALEKIDMIAPGTLILLTGTLNCRRFANYWRNLNQYPLLKLPPNYYKEENYYNLQELDQDQIATIKQQVKRSRLNMFYPPKIYVVDKGMDAASLRWLLEYKILKPMFSFALPNLSFFGCCQTAAKDVIPFSDIKPSTPTVPLTPEKEPEISITNSSSLSH